MKPSIICYLLELLTDLVARAEKLHLLLETGLLHHHDSNVHTVLLDL